MNTSIVYWNMTQEEIQQAYDQLAPDYDRMTFVERAVFGIDRQRRRLFDGVSGRVLDVACGTGANFPFLHTADHITGIDLSPRMLDIARHKAGQLGPSVDLRVMDAQQLEFEDGSFDVVVSALSTCTFPDPVVALREMGRVVKPGGAHPAARTWPQQLATAGSLPGSDRPSPFRVSGLPLEPGAARSGAGGGVGRDNPPEIVLWHLSRH